MANYEGEYVDVHTHTEGEGICVRDRSDGSQPLAGELYSLGIHPLFPEKCPGLERIREEAAGGRLAALGEAGFDRNSGLSLEKQKEFFEDEIRISEDCHLPLIIHCVRAFPELLSLRKAMKPSQPWIIHGYDNNGQILEELLKHGCYISAGKKLLSGQSNIRRLLKEIPDDRLFLETDDSVYGIEEVYREAAFLRGVSVERLKESIFQNWLEIRKEA